MHSQHYQSSAVVPMPLLRLAKICDWGGLRKAFDKATQEQIEATDEYGMHVLHWAVTEANIPIGLLEYLIRVFPHGVRLFSSGGFLPLHLALMAGASVSRIERLVESFPQSTTLPIPSGHTPYMIYQERLPMDTQALKRADGQPGTAVHAVHVWGNILVGHVLKSPHWRFAQASTTTPAPLYRGRSIPRRLSASGSTNFTASPIMLRSDKVPPPSHTPSWYEVEEDLGDAFDWREIGRRMAADEPKLDDIVDDKLSLLVHAATRAPFELFEWILSLCPECARMKTSAGLLPLHVAMTQHASARRLQKLLDAYPESIHVLTRDGESAWMLAQKVQSGPATQDLLRQVGATVA
ncbi:Aste57867_16764 [Aphanomyces stellatus]|uniref:Aste57867_16764 protein n=1 Tax=Aphanomyces stellatus TaxID=120398 RepID=A0A485L6Z8_9STRA|nr:hypothetical protein As57867_016707 [Aphanomyces stellatus]VFT93529.1 Aste57867_16764 [Aphanomyces stellatus]